MPALVTVARRWSCFILMGEEKQQRGHSSAGLYLEYIGEYSETSPPARQ